MEIAVCLCYGETIYTGYTVRITGSKSQLETYRKARAKLIMYPPASVGISGTAAGSWGADILDTALSGQSPKAKHL